MDAARTAWHPVHVIDFTVAAVVGGGGGGYSIVLSAVLTVHWGHSPRVILAQVQMAAVAGRVPSWWSATVELCECVCQVEPDIALANMGSVMWAKLSVKVLFDRMLPDFRKNMAFWKAPRLRNFVGPV